MKFLIAGLGNIGPEYETTRHNIGFLILDQLADKFDKDFELSRLALKTDFRSKGRSVHLIKPTTYMNLSGRAVKFWLNDLKIPKASLLIVTDDIALPFGKLRMRAKGSDAGHNGLRSIDEHLEGNDYARLRVGIGNEFPKGGQVDYVLSPFKNEQWVQIPAIIDKACEMILSFTSIGIARTMDQFN